jgi:hypothetical protein
MTERQRPDNGSRWIMDLLALVGRLTFVTTSAFAYLATVVALVAIGVMLILEL